jgi:hypothetical protein
LLASSWEGRRDGLSEEEGTSSATDTKSDGELDNGTDSIPVRQRICSKNDVNLSGYVSRSCELSSTTCKRVIDKLEKGKKKISILGEDLGIDYSLQMCRWGKKFSS